MGGSYRTWYEETLELDSQLAPSGLLVYYADGDEEILHVNQYVVDLFECDSVEDFMSYTKGSFRNVVYRDDVGAAEDSIWGQVRTRDGLDHIYYRIKTRHGTFKSVDDYGRLVEREGERPVFYVFLVEIVETGSVDWLTGLPDKARFQNLAQLGCKRITDRGERPVAVAFDLMGMKTYNTRHGRVAGDELLQSFANVMRNTFGSEACSRFGEDHFYAFAPEEGIERKVSELFEKFRSASSRGALPVRAGIYACDPSDDIVAIAFDRAKIACDLDRDTWASHVTWYTDQMREAVRMRVYVLEHLDQAIAEGWICPYYQGVVRAATGEVCGEEALARWIDPQFGVLPPDKFIPVLEEAGLLYKVDLYMLDRVVADMRTKREQGVSIVPVSVNISLRDLNQHDIAMEVSMRADAVGLPHGLLHIEFTESAVSSDNELFRSQVNALRAAGFEVWMDDFGSGYSSLNTLQEFDFDLIKLDMAFIRSEQVEKSHIIVAGVVQAAGKLGVGTLAEGVETEEQARFLESIGCDMLQGYFYARPKPLDQIISEQGEPGAPRRESFAENAYWSSLSLVSLVDIPADDGQDVDMSPMSQIPMGVMEWRDDTWHVLRANQGFEEFLRNVDIISDSYSPLVSNLVAGRPDEELGLAATRARQSDRWERIMGRKEYGSGYQYYVRHIASTDSADAYLLAGAPTMLGSGLGTFGDVPVGYAVFRVILNEAGTEVVDSEYVYANAMYCAWGGFDQGSIMGRSFLETANDASRAWFPYCYRAAVLGENVHDIIYSPETGHWLSFNVAPSAIEGCCVFAFTFADDEQRERSEMIAGRDTSDLIISIADALGGEASYDVAMNNLLKTMSQVIHPERLYIYERGETTTSNTFEWCAEGVEPQIHTLQNVDNSEFVLWNKQLTEHSVVVITDVSELRDVDERMYDQLTRQGITHTLAVPLYSEGELIGYLGADNYELDEDLDTLRLLKTIASFIGARIANRRLVDELRHAGTHDSLTGLLDRRGIDQAIGAWLEEHPGEPYVLALMDVDDFKIVNDVYGHDLGDEALRVLSRRVTDAFCKRAIVGRNGGDEFLVMIPGPCAQQADELIASFSSQRLSCEYGGREYDFSMSIGYAGYPAQARDLMEVYSRADAALYSVKLGGKGGYCRYAPYMDSQFRSQLGFTPRDIAAHMPGAILVHEPGDGQILFANAEMLQLFECESLDEFMAFTGGTYGGIIHPDDRERVREELAEQAEEVGRGAKDYVNFRIVTKAGNVCRVADNGRQVEVEGMGTIFYELIINRDERGVR